jgi:hypothetical protein
MPQPVKRLRRAGRSMKCLPINRRDEFVAAWGWTSIAVRAAWPTS